MPDNLDEIELRSEEVQEILSKVPHWMIRWGNVLFLSLIIMVLALCWFVKYPDIISSQAIITTQIPPQKEYARITSNIDTILVKDNDTVQQHQPLAVLENTAKYEDVFLLRSILDTLRINNKSFNFPIESIPVLFLGDIDSDFALFENSFIQYKLNKELQPFSNKAVANRFSVSELKRRLANLNAQKELNASELSFKEKDLKRNESLFQKGVISAMEYENKQLEYLQAERNYKSMSVSVSQIREAINNASSNLKGTEINKTKEEMVLLKNVIQSYNQLKKSIKDWEMRYLLQSNINGKVTFLNFWTENQNVNQGDLVFTIIPTKNSSFIAKLKTPAQNSGKIQLGQKVNIKIENYPDAEFGTLQGEVVHISLIPDTEGFYLIDVSLPSTLITSYNKQIEFKQEMRGVAEIITEDLRLIERFFYQFKELVSR
ncbi:MAG: HlyD family secretion protein [Patiriisocius sp.]|uniref:HlyD family secretion protein n=1 Tax=Patiriisocius sp. TaxID=2822396 RepID=UPI003EF293FC